MIPKIQVQKTDTFGGHREAVYTLLAAPAPTMFFSAAADGYVVRWDLQQPDVGKLVAQVGSSVYAIAYVAGSAALVVGENFAGLHLISLEQNKQIVSVSTGKAAIFDILAYEGLIFAAHGDGKITIHHADTLNLLQTLQFSNDSVRALALNPHAYQLVAAYSDHSIRVIDLKTFQVLHTLGGHTNSVFTIAFSPDFRFLLSGSRDAHLKVWDVTQGYTPHQSIVAHLYTINHIAFHPTKPYFATCSKDKAIKVWDSQSFKLLKVIDKARHAGHGTSVNKLLWLADKLISCSDDRSIAVWAVELPQ